MKLHAKQIEAFLAFMETSSLFEAADRLNVSQPAVTRMLQRFQHEVGFEAFEKKGTRLVATAASDSFYLEAKRHYLGIRHLDMIANELRMHRRGFLRLGMINALSNSWIMERLDGFLNEPNNIQVSVTQHDSKTLSEMLTAQTLDMAFVSSCQHEPSNSYSLVYSSPLVCTIHPSNPLVERKYIRAQDLRNQNIVSLSELSELKKDIDSAMDLRKHSNRSRIVVDDASSACHAVACNFGVAILPKFTVLEHRHLDYVWLPLRPRIVCRIFLAIAKNKQSSGICDSFIKHMKSK